MTHFWFLACIFVSVLLSELLLALLLGVLAKLGKTGKTISESLCQAPALDGVVSVIIWMPWVVSALKGGWLGLLACITGQFVAMQLWILGHERLYRSRQSTASINGLLDQRFGWWRNELALWITAIALPAFFLIRFAEICVYPWLTWILGFKSYDHRDWVNVSRHKFEGLIGRDLIWCLYCDWMTGVYSLGAEMLRNVESFWCPIRFYSDKKCENCSLDFPDINAGWVAAAGTMTDVVQVLETEIDKNPTWSWFGDRAITSVSESDFSEPQP